MEKNLKTLKRDILRYRITNVFYAFLLALYAWLIADWFYDDFFHQNSLWVNIGCVILIIIIAWVRNVEIKNEIKQEIGFLMGLSHVVIKVNQERLVSLLSLKEEFSSLCNYADGAKIIADRLSEIHDLKKDRVIEYCKESKAGRTEIIASEIEIPIDFDEQRKLADELDEEIREDTKREKLILAELEKIEKKFTK
jgi:hypothetical protein